MTRSLLLLLAAGLAPVVLHGQSFSGGGASIPDDGNVLEAPLVVSGLSPTTIDTVGFGVERICINVQHEWLADLDIRVIAPDGSTATLTTGNGGDTDLYANTCFTADAGTSILFGSAPFTGDYRAQGQLGLVNNGQAGNGTWKLRILDTYPFADAGQLLSWSITFGPAPAHYIALTTSDLPIVVLHTVGATIPDEPKMDGTMGIIDNGPGQLNHITDPFNGYNGNIGIETRGNSSQMFPKKSFGFELRDTWGLALDASLLGMPAENDWVLSANYSDKSLLNNPLTFDLGQRLGYYAPRWRHVEVVLNGEYIGVYVLMEKIKRGGGRVDIAKLTVDEISGDDLTGGYIVQIDRSNEPGWTSSYLPATYFQYVYPKAPAPEQAAYIQAYVDSFETALDGPDFADPATGYARYIDVPSVIDYMLVTELGKNVDGYRLSGFFYKDKDSNGGKLHLGPLWDFDLAYHNADYCQGGTVQGWAYSFNQVCGGDGDRVPFWWHRFLEDPAFVDQLRCRWEEVRNTVFDVERIQAWCDSMATRLAGSQQRNFRAWPILGEYVWPNPSPLPDDFAGEIAELKAWINARHNWIDDNLQGQCTTVGIADVRATDAPTVQPDPFADRFLVRLPMPVQGPVRLALIDPLGRDVLVRTLTPDMQRSLEVDVPAGCRAGTYVLRIDAAEHRWAVPVMKMGE